MFKRSEIAHNYRLKKKHKTKPNKQIKNNSLLKKERKKYTKNIIIRKQPLLLDWA